MPPREIREYACPLLQPPINRLFVPRPIPDYVKPHDRDPEKRTGSRIGPVATFMEAFKKAVAEDNSTDELSPKIIKQKKVNLGNNFFYVYFKYFYFLFRLMRKRDF